MKAILTYAAVTSSLCISAASAQPPAPKSLVIALDGLRGDGIINAQTPNIDRLSSGAFGASRGVDYRGAYAYYAQTISDAATISGPNHASIMTGVTAIKHGVFGNCCLDSGNWSTYPHYLNTLESADAQLNTAYLFTWSPDGSITSGADYIKDGNDADNAQRVADILAGKFQDPNGDQGTGWSAGTDVDAVFLFLDDIDLAGHNYSFNPTSDGYLNRIATADLQIGRILDALEARPSFPDENWQVLIVSDHGGRGTSHGWLAADNTTIPFLVASRDAGQGFLQGTPGVVDVAPTTVRHMLGPGAIPGHYDGQPRGDQVLESHSPNLADGLVVYLPLNGSLLDASGRHNDATVGIHSDHDPTVYSGGGKFGGYLEINDFGGGPDQASYVSLGRPADLDFGEMADFSFTLWFRKNDRAGGGGNTVILGDVDLASGHPQGTILEAVVNREAGSFSLRTGDAMFDSAELETVSFPREQWWLLASTFDRDGNAILYAGDPQGRLQILSAELTDVNELRSMLPFNLGQDGTGAYAHNLDGDIDDLAIWTRPLTLAEIELVFNGGGGVELARLVPEPVNGCPWLLGSLVQLLLWRSWCAGGSVAQNKNAAR